MQRIRQNSHAVCPNPSDNFQNSKRQIQEEGNADPLANRRSVRVSMMRMTHVVITSWIVADLNAQLNAVNTWKMLTRDLVTTPGQSRESVERKITDSSHLSAMD